MTPHQHVETLATTSAHLASLAAGSLDQRIGFLEGWTVRDLVAHLGAAYSTVIAATAHPGTEPVSVGEAAKAPEGDAITSWFAERRTTVLATLTEARDDAEAWTFRGVKTAGWWKRRIGCETAIHAWDVAAAVKGLDQAGRVDTNLATDGVDEYLTAILANAPARPARVYPQQSLHLHRSDGPGEWMVTADEGDLVVTHEHGKGDAAVRGDASDLFLWVWGRPTSQVEIFGDPAVADAWRSLAP